MKPLRFFCSTIAVCLFALPINAENRTWTDAATNRTLEGSFVEIDGDNVEILLTSGKSIDVAINRLVEADKDYIKKQSASVPAANESNPFREITPPVSVKSLPITGSGEDREAGLEVTNNGEKAISKLRVDMFLFAEDGSLTKKVPHTSDGIFDSGNNTLGKGKKSIINLSDFWIKDDIASVAGLTVKVTWEDGTTWPAWAGPEPKKEGKIPVSLVMKGILRDGEMTAPFIECFNHSSKGVRGIRYRLYYLDDAGTELNKARRTGISSRDENLIEPGAGYALIGSEAPPEGATQVKLVLHSVEFEDDTKWSAED